VSKFAIATHSIVVGGQLAPTFAALGHRAVMRTKRPDRYDLGFSALGVLVSYAFVVFANGRGWPTSVSIIALVLASIPIGLVLGWLKSRLQVRSRNVR
jgi:ribose/xylose/arabinose/galactoside ABC-type transport system permease subunit